MELYKHQADAVSQLMYEVEVIGSKNVILFAPTSYGKSIVLSTLAKELDGKIIIMVNITALIDQIAEHLDEINQDYSILKAGYENKFDPKKKIQLVMSQTYYARSDKINFGPVEVVCQDEGHREWMTTRTTHLLNTIKPKARIAVSGTPFDESGYALEGVDATINTKSISELESEDFVVPVKYFIPHWSEKIDYSSLRSSGADYSGAAIEEVINTNDHTDLIVQSMNQMNAKNKKTIVFANSIEHADTIAEALVLDGYQAYSYHSENKPEEAEIAMTEFRTNKAYSNGLIDGKKLPIKCIVAVSKISTGFSVKDIELGVMCRPTKILSLFHQMTGRLIRTYPDKKYVECLDLAQLVATHGFHNEPYSPPKKGNKQQLRKEKENREAPVIQSMVNEEPTQITREMVDLAIEELRQKERKIPELTMKELGAMYEISYKLETIIHIFYEINKRTRGLNYNQGSITWTMKTWNQFIEEFPEYKHRIFQSLKTRGKNITKNQKKTGSLHYFPQWLREQPPFIYKDIQ